MTLPNIEEQWTASFYTPNAKVPSWGIGPRVYDYITIHWWGDTTDFMTVINTFCNGGKQTSAHYVAEAGRVACVVSPWDAAWACGNLDGNRRSISIECNPLGRDEDYQTVADLIAYLRAQYGDLPLVPHNYWVATACPGNYDLNRLDQLARGSHTVPTNIPTGDTDVAYSQWSDEDKNALYHDIWFGRPGAQLIVNRLSNDQEWPETFLGSLEDRIAAKIAAIPTGNTAPAAGVPAIDQNTIDAIAGRVADIMAQRLKD